LTRRVVRYGQQRGIDLALDHPYRTRAILAGDPLGRGLPHGRDDHGDEVTTVQHQADGSVCRARAGRRVAHKRADSFSRASTAVGSLPKQRVLIHNTREPKLVPPAARLRT
jgi:hypothetical protein